MAAGFLLRLRPEPALTVSTWADANRILPSVAAAEAGPYRTRRTPYLREVMDNFSATSPIQRVVFMKGAQIGASEAGNNWVGYVMDQAPGPMMIVQPTVDLAKRYSNQRIAPLIKTTDRLVAKVAQARSRDSSNTTLMKEFLGGVLVLTGANSAVGLRSMPVRYLFLDEVDAYPGDVEDEGDPVALAEMRTSTFAFRSKTYLASTPRMKGTSRIERAYQASDRRRYFVPCPFCGHAQPLEFKRLRWEAGRPETAAYHCEGCEEPIGEQHKTTMLEEGEWRATAESDDPLTRGYHLSALYSPVGWLSWPAIAKKWEAGADDPDARKTFINTVLGECWEEEAEAVPDWRLLYERREDYDPRLVPLRGLFLTAGVDVQIDRLEVDIWAWGRGLESWLVEHRVLMGDPARPETWAPLSAMLSETWMHESGKRLTLQRMAVDTGAFTQSVYQWVRAQSRQAVIAVKGMAKYDRIVPVGGPTYVETTQHGVKVKRGIALWAVSTSFFKREFYKQLGLHKPTDEDIASGLGFPAGYVHLSTQVSDEWCKQLVAERQVVIRNKRGFAVRTEWQPTRPRNEALDIRVYARAAAWLAGADRWNESRWRDLEGQLDLGPPPPPTPAPAKPFIAAPVTERALDEPPPPPGELGGMLRRRGGGRRVVRF